MPSTFSTPWVDFAKDSSTQAKALREWPHVVIGIMPCLTPSGTFFSIAMGRFVTGLVVQKKTTSYYTLE